MPPALFGQTVHTCTVLDFMSWTCASPQRYWFVTAAWGSWRLTLFSSTFQTNSHVLAPNTHDWKSCGCVVGKREGKPAFQASSHRKSAFWYPKMQLWSLGLIVLPCGKSSYVVLTILPCHIAARCIARDRWMANAFRFSVTAFSDQERCLNAPRLRVGPIKLSNAWHLSGLVSKHSSLHMENVAPGCEFVSLLQSCKKIPSVFTLERPPCVQLGHEQGSICRRSHNPRPSAKDTETR